MSDETPVESQGLRSAFGALFREPVAIGLALMLFLRPWRDGVTFRGWDAYFLWIALAMAAMWGARMLLRGEPIRYPRFAGLFLLYVVCGLLSAIDTFQVDATYRALLLWWCYFLVFALATNALQSRFSVAIVLTGFIASALPNAAWAIIHVKYTLGYLREMMEKHGPQFMEAYGVGGDLSSDFVHRIESNRAFGTLLYPNALAAYLLLVIPVAFCFLIPAWRSFRLAFANPRDRADRRYLSAAMGIAVWFFVTACSFFLYPFLLLVITQDTNWAAHTGSVVFFLLVVPVALGVLAGWLVRTRGLLGLGLTTAIAGLAATSVIALVAFYMTYSRGGFLAFGAAVTVTVALMIGGRKGIRLPWRLAAVGILILIPLVAGFAQRSYAQEPSAIDVAGRPQDLASMTDPSSFRARLDYWKIGWRMFTDNVFTGVGIGNFGTAYAKYQFAGAHASQTAHNALVKALAETGLIGFVGFCAFWFTFLLWGAARVLDAANDAQRWRLAGLYCAVLAFLLHSLLDFNFANAALTMPAVCLTGLFCALVGIERKERPAATSTRSRLIALPVLLLVALTLGASLRVFFFDLAFVEGSIARKLFHVGERVDVRTRAAAANFFLDDLLAHPPENGQPAFRKLSSVLPLFPNLDRVRSFAEIREPVPGNSGMFRMAPMDRAPSPEAMVVIRDVDRARVAAVEMSEIWLDAMTARDSLYPHDPEIAGVIYEWYDLLQKHEPDPERRKKWIGEMVKWGEAGVERSPQQPWFHTYVGKALLTQGTVLRGNDSVETYREALAAYRRGTELSPEAPLMWQQYGTAMTKVGDAFVRSGMTEEGEGLVREGQEALARAEELIHIEAARRGAV